MKTKQNFFIIINVWSQLCNNEISVLHLFVKSLNLGTKIPTLVVEWRNLKHEFRGGSCLNCKGGEGYFAFEAEAAMLLT